MGSIDPPTKFNIIIVGAGIAGLTAALGLHQKGHHVTILERNTDTQALGGPLNMSPSATRIFIEYGLEEVIRSQLIPNAQSYDQQFRRYSDGKTLGSTPPGHYEKIFGSGVWTASRFGWQKLFRQTAEERGIKVEFSAPIHTVDVENTTVILRDGQKLKADLVIGADGIGSLVRSIVLGDEKLERRNPVGAINIEVPLSALKDDPEVAALSQEGQNFWLGPGGGVAAGAVPDTNVWNATFTSEERMGSQGEWFNKGDIASVAKKHQDWDPRLLKIISKAKPDDCYVWNITDMPPLPTWSRGNTVIIGDAAHATLPFLGMGATTCVEDGRCLAECLDRAKDVDDIPRVLEAFQQLRKPRVESIIAMSRATMKMWHLENGEQQIQRDALYAGMSSTRVGTKPWDGTPIDDPPKRWGEPNMMIYLKCFSTAEFTNRKLDEMKV